MLVIDISPIVTADDRIFNILEFSNLKLRSDLITHVSGFNHNFATVSPNKKFTNY